MSGGAERAGHVRDDGGPDGLGGSWTAEIMRRRREIMDGTVRLLDEDEVFAQIAMRRRASAAGSTEDRDEVPAPS